MLIGFLKPDKAEQQEKYNWQNINFHRRIPIDVGVIATLLDRTYQFCWNLKGSWCNFFFTFRLKEKLMRF